MKTSKTERLNSAYRELVVRKIVDNKKDFANEIGYNYAGVVAAMSGNRPTTIQMLSAIGYKWDFFNREWLQKGAGSITSDESPPNTQTFEDNLIVPKNQYMVVEVRDLDESPSRIQLDASLLPKEKVRIIPKEKDKGYYIITTVEGDRMDDGSKRSLSDGDEILVKQYIGGYSTLPIRSKLFVIYSMDGNVVTQITHVDSETKDITCRSFNQLYKDYIIKSNNIIQIFTIEKKLSSRIVF